MRQNISRTSLDASWSYAGGYSEPEAGSDMLALRTKATRTPDGDFVVTGQKMWTSGAHLADWIYTLVRSEPDSTRHHGLSLLMIDAHAPGVTIQPVRVMGGWRVNACFFDDVHVPARALIGQAGQAWTMMSRALDMERSMSFGGREARLLLARYLDRIGKHGTLLMTPPTATSVNSSWNCRPRGCSASRSSPWANGVSPPAARRR